jgi:hypothetical protein
MKLIKINVLINKYDGIVNNHSDLEDSLREYYIRSKQIFLNVDTIRSVSTIKVCKEYYEPYREIGKYFTVECTDSTVYNLPENQFSKFEKFIVE